METSNYRLEYNSKQEEFHLEPMDVGRTNVSAHNWRILMENIPDTLLDIINKFTIYARTVLFKSNIYYTPKMMQKELNKYLEETILSEK